MARVVVMDLIVRDPIAVVEIPDSFLLAVARQAEKPEIRLRPEVDGHCSALTLRLEKTFTVTGKMLWTLTAIDASGAIEVRGAFLPEPQDYNPTAHAIRQALSYLVR